MADYFNLRMKQLRLLSFYYIINSFKYRLYFYNIKYSKHDFSSTTTAIVVECPPRRLRHCLDPKCRLKQASGHKEHAIASARGWCLLKKKHHNLKQPHAADLRGEEESHHRGAFEDSEHADVAS